MVDRIIRCEFLLLYISQAQLSFILFYFYSHSANWSADTRLCGSEYALIFDDCASIFNLDISQSHLRCQIN